MVTIKDIKYLTPAETAKKIGRSKHFVYHNYKKWNWRKHLYGSSSVLFEEAQVDEWLDKQIQLTTEKD